ncbi:MAG TPA: outer membrane protein [Pseudolabrys sp.]|jgi:outer membrane immunogenic protein|nr:outer membrane protein [Pseudolabrys sp.]
MLKSCVKLAALAVGVFIGSQAYAADLPVKAPPMAPVVAPAMTWTGFYIGPNIGFGWADVGLSGSSHLDGVVGGGQLGYNWQAGSFVFGIEGDIQGSGENRSDTVGGVTFDQRIPFIATARGRVGYVAGPVLIYFTGGGAWQNYHLTVSVPGASVSDDDTKFGWTIGGGVEWMFAQNWSAKVEYLRIDTGDTTVSLLGTDYTSRLRNNIIRVGLNYHF